MNYDEKLPGEIPDYALPQRSAGLLIGYEELSKKISKLDDEWQNDIQRNSRVGSALYYDLAVLFITMKKAQINLEKAMAENQQKITPGIRISAAELQSLVEQCEHQVTVYRLTVG